MAADTGVNVEGFRAEIEGDKYSSRGDLPPVSVGGGIDVDCNGDGKDDYVLVNGSDVAEDSCEPVADPRESFAGIGTNGSADDLPEVCNDDPVERAGDKEVGSSELSVDLLENVDGGDVNGDHHSEAVNGDSDVLNNEVKIDDLKNDNGVDVDAESNCKIEDGELLRENGDINLHVEDVAEKGKSRIENDGITLMEGEVHVKESGSKVVEENCSKPLTNGFNHGESCILNGGDCNSLVNGTSTTVISEGAEPSNMLEPCATPSANNDVQSKIPCELTDHQINGPESLIAGAVECQIAEDVQSDVVDVVGDVEALDCKHQPIHEEVLGVQPSHSDSEDTQLADSSVPEASDVEVRESLVNDATSKNQPSDYQQPELKQDDGECKELGDVEVEANYLQPELKPASGESNELGSFQAESTLQQPELKPTNGESEELAGVETDAMFQLPELKPANKELEELGDVDTDATVTGQCELELPEDVENQEPSSNNFDAATSDVLENAEVVEVNGQAVMSSIVVLEGADNVNGAESASMGMERVVCDDVGNDDISNNELPAKVDQSQENSMDVQSGTTDKPSIHPAMERVDVNETLEFVAEEAGDHKSAVEDNITMDQLVADSGSVDVQGKDIVLEEVELERNVEVKEETRQSNWQAANNLEATTNDLCGVEAAVNNVASDVIHSQIVSVSGEGSVVADGALSRPVDTAMCLTGPSELDSITEREQGCSVDDNTSSQNNVDNSAPSLHASDGKLQRTSGADVDVVNMSNNIQKPTIRFGSFICKAPFPYGDVNARPKVLNHSVALTSSKSKAEPSDGNSLLTSEGNGTHITKSGPGKASENLSECVSDSDGTPLITSEANEIHLTEVGPGKASEYLSEEHASNNDNALLLTSEASKVHLTESGPGKASENWSVERASNDKLSTLPVKASGPDVINKQNLSTESVRRPFLYFIRIPRYNDENLTREINLHELKVDEKTRMRKSFQDECRKAKEISDELKSDFEAAIEEERAAWELLRAKQNELKSAKSLINLARNAVTVEDVQNQIEHETLNLNDEKQLIPEIKKMKIMKGQLNANRQNQEKVLQALDRSVEVEERLKGLKKDLEPLQDKHARAKQRVEIAKKKLDEHKLLQNDLFIKLRSADSVQQKAYEDWKTLKQQLFDKNKIFYKYKDDAKAANALAVAGDKDRLEQHCVNQVENIMELWNKDDKFRNEYIRCNKRSTLRRFGTLDGRSLGPNEEPPSIPTVSYNRETSVAKVNPVATVSSTETALPRKIKAEHNSSKKIVEPKDKITLNKKVAKVAPKNSSVEASGRLETIEKEKEIEEVKLTKEEIELEKKAEQQRREEEAARLREQKRLDEIAKAKEALERKKRMAEKAQARAEFRARKEAEEKEKVREKRAKKKGKKRESTSEMVEFEPAVLAESASGASREPEATEKPVTALKRSTKALPYTKQMKITKSILPPPPPVRNRGRNKIKPWWWCILLAICVLALFYVGDSNVFRDLSGRFGLSS